MGTRDNVTHNVIPPAGPARHVPSPVGRLHATLAVVREATYGQGDDLACGGSERRRARCERTHAHAHVQRALSLSLTPARVQV